MDNRFNANNAIDRFILGDEYSDWTHTYISDSAVPYCDITGKRICSPVLPPIVNPKLDLIVRGKNEHEAGHARFTPADKKANWSKIKGMLVNSLEDLRIEKGLKTLSSVFATDLETMNADLISSQQNDFKAGKYANMKPINEALMALHYTGNGFPPSWAMSPTAQAYYTVALPIFKEWELANHTSKAGFAKIEEIADRILAKWEELKSQMQNSENGEGEDTEDNEDSNSNSKSSKDKSKSSKSNSKSSKSKSSKDKDATDNGEDTEGEDTEGDSTDNGEGDSTEDNTTDNGEGEGEDKDTEDNANSTEDTTDNGEGEGEGENTEDSNSTEGDSTEDSTNSTEGNSTEDTEDSTNSTEGNTNPQSGDGNATKTNAGSLEDDFEDKDYDNEALSEELKKAFEDSKKSFGSYTPYTAEDETILAGESVDNFNRAFSNIRGATSVLSSYLSQSLKTLSRCRVIGNRDKGSLNVQRNATNICKSLTKNLFERTTKGISLDTTVSILIDESGSIGYYTSCEFQKIVIAFAEVLDRLGINFEVLGHTTGYAHNLKSDQRKLFSRTSTMKIYEHKRLNVPYRQERYRLGTIGYENSNIDGEALLETYKRNSVKRSQRHVIFVFSDGLPNCYCDSTAKLYKNLTDTVNFVRSNGTEVYAFGIGTDAPEKFYGKENFIYLQSVNDMTSAFFHKVAEVITNGQR